MRVNKKPASINGIARTVSDIFSKQYCDMGSAKKYAISKTNGHCFYCGEEVIKVHNGKAKAKVKKYCFDHIYPASKLNLFEVGNIALACETCNLSKSDKPPLEFYKKRKLYSLNLFFEDKKEFETFLKTFTEPYAKKWPKIYNMNFSESDINYFRETLVGMMYEIDFIIRENIIKEKTNGKVVIDEKYFNRFLTQEDKQEIVKTLDIRNERGLPVGWPTTKKILINSGYKIEDKIKKTKGVRKSCSIIIVRENIIEAKTNDKVVIDEKYFNKPLFRNDKLEISEIVSSSSSFRWPTTKKILINSGYKIEDKIKKIKGVRKSYSIITN